MPSARQGAIRLFRVAGIDVFLHWSWFVVAVFEINGRARSYSSLTFNVLENLALFLIVMLHEYGHALACRQVGGTADQIVLWPLGGVAYVNPPPRPGVTLWSIAAGPLVNLVLVPVLSLLGILSRSLGWATAVSAVEGGLVHELGTTNFQHAAHLSLGRRSDSSVSPTRQQEPGILVFIKTDLDEVHAAFPDLGAFTRRWFVCSRIGEQRDGFMISAVF